MFQSERRMKDSGIEWLGEIPVEWSTGAVKHLFSIQLGKMLQPTTNPGDSSVPYLKASHVQWEDVHLADLPEMWASARDLRIYGVRNGDLLICEGGEVGRSATLASAPQLCIIQNALHRVREREEASSRFLMYLMRHISGAGWFSVLCNKATIAHLTGEKLGDIRIPLPMLEEQREIAAYLDRKTAVIDALIRRKERLIELLQEKRQAVISRLVTNGLSTTASMEMTEIPWMPVIPAHWETTRLKHAAALISDCLHSTPLYSEDGEFPAVRTSDIAPGVLSLGGAKRVDRDMYLERTSRAIPRAGDIVYSREGERFGMAATVPSDTQLCLAQRVMLIRAAVSHNNRFLMWQLNSHSAFRQVEQDTIGSTSPHVNVETIRNLVIAKPPRSEQDQIAEYLDLTVGRIDRAVNGIQSSIQMLIAYRQTLISNAVTGKIDVRQEALACP